VCFKNYVIGVEKKMGKIFKIYRCLQVLNIHCLIILRCDTSFAATVCDIVVAAHRKMFSYFEELTGIFCFKCMMCVSVSVCVYLCVCVCECV
jgi:hypothetical protein